MNQELDELQLYQDSKDFVVVNPYNKDDQIDDLDIDYFIEHVTKVVGIKKYGHFGPGESPDSGLSEKAKRVTWKFKTREDFILKVPSIAKPYIVVVFTFFIDWEKKKYFLKSIVVGKNTMNKMQGRTFIGQIYGDIRHVWENVKFHKYSGLTNRADKENGAGCFKTAFWIAAFFFVLYLLKRFLT
jgi:hypothetical protein